MHSEALPNIIIMLSDDQGYGDLGCHGNPILKTPNLDALHAGSVRLTDFHVTPMCTPTRGQLMTALDALHNRAVWIGGGRTFVRRSIPTMADLFRENGYRTGIFGKWHLGENYPYRPEDRGFDETVYFKAMAIGSASDYWDNDYFDDHYLHNGRMEQYQGYCTDVFFNEAMRWMLQCQREKRPFLTYLPTGADHVPFFVPDHYREPYRHLGIYLSSFFGMIANQDENVGRLDQFLRDTNLFDNTIVIFMTDNGTLIGSEIFDASMRGTKGSLYEGGHRVPCFIRWPDGHLDTRDESTPAQVQDILPTLLELCGLHPQQPTTFDGLSLAPLLRDRNLRIEERTLVIQHNIPKKFNATIIRNQYRLVLGESLYDISKDPGQKTEIAALHPEIVQSMREYYEQWWNQLDDDLLVYERIVIGHERENPTCLTHLDSDRTNGLDYQPQIRCMESVNGPTQPPSGKWYLEAARAGRYTFALARWPAEASTPIAAGLPLFIPQDDAFCGVPKPDETAAKGMLHAWISAIGCEGKSLPIHQARIWVGEHDQTLSVSAADLQATFHLTLPVGPLELKTMFYDADGNPLGGAFYVTITYQP